MNTAKPKPIINRAKRAAVFGLQSLNHLVWPAVCANCAKSIGETDGQLCKECWGELLACTGSEYCPRCGRNATRYAIVQGCCPDCQGKDFIFDSIARSGLYAKALRKMILAFKSDRTELISVLAFLANSTLQACNFYDNIHLFVPVPLHWSRRLARGCNQSLLLAKKLKHPKATISTDLVRTRRTKPQVAAVSAAARAANVGGAFAVRYRHLFEGQNICLVDDIKTTGATLNECAKTLKNAGATKVFALVLAVAGQNIN